MRDLYTINSDRGRGGSKIPKIRLTSFVHAPYVYNILSLVGLGKKPCIMLNNMTFEADEGFACRVGAKAIITAPRSCFMLPLLAPPNQSHVVALAFQREFVWTLHRSTSEMECQ